MSVPLRIAHGIMAALFAYSVILQFNDLNPGPWIALYGACAIAAASAAAGRPFKRFALGVLIVCALWEVHYLSLGAWRVPITSLADEWTMKNESIIIGREFWALIFLGGWTAVVWRSKTPTAPAKADD